MHPQYKEGYKKLLVVFHKWMEKQWRIVCRRVSDMILTAFEKDCPASRLENIFKGSKQGKEH